MTAARKPPSSKREHIIPVKVMTGALVAPTTQPPSPAATRLPTKPASQKTPVLAQPLKKLRTPVHEWPETRRRHLMWWLVGGAMAVIVTAWISIIRLELMTPSGRTSFFQEIQQAFSAFRPSSSATPTSPTEQEIRQLDDQVFPQFQP